MSEDGGACLLDETGGEDLNVVDVKQRRKKRVLTRNRAVGDGSRCRICDRDAVSAATFKGPPEEAMEEEAALTDERLQLYDGNGFIPEIDSKPVHRLTNFSVYDGEGHLCEFDSGLIENNKHIFCSGYVKPVYDEDPSTAGGVPVQEIGPILLWWISGFDGGDNYLLALASPCAEYILMEPSEEYAPFMGSPRRKALMTKIAVEFLSNSSDPSFEELMSRIQELGSIDESTLQANAQFVVDQISELDDDGELLSTPAMQTMLELYNLKRGSAKSKAPALRLSKAYMTPVVSHMFERFFKEAYFASEGTLEKPREEFAEDVLGSYSWEEGDGVAVVNGVEIKKGDFVAACLADPLSKTRMYRVEYFFVRNFTKQAHCTVYWSGADTVVAESSNPLEFFFVGKCLDCPLGKITKKLNVDILAPGEDFFGYRAVGKTYFVQKRYHPRDARFEDYDSGKSCSCGAVDELEVFGPEDSYDLVRWRGEDYARGCCVCVEPFAITLNAEKSSRRIEKVLVRLKADERIYPEMYRKGKEGDAEERPEPFKIAYVRKMFRTDGGIRFEVNKFYRPEDTGLVDIDADMYLLFWSEEVAEVELENVKGLCDVVNDRFSRNGEFYYGERFDSERRSLEPVGAVVPLLRRSDPRKTEISDKLRTMNIFCGSGGLAEGLTQSGVAEVRWGIELDENASKAFKANFPNSTVYNIDCNEFLRRVTGEAGSGYPSRGEVDLLCGGPPCQGYSSMNRFTARQYSRFKNSLIVTYLSFCDYYRPKYVLLENVRNFTSFKKSSVLKCTLSCLLSMGYQCAFAVLQAGNYGVPQNRRRLFVMATAPGVPLPRFPAPTHVFHGLKNLDVDVDGRKYNPFASSGSAPLRSVTIRDALADLRRGSNEELTPYQKYCMTADTVLRDQIWKELSPLNEARVKHVPVGKNCDWRDLPNIVVRLRDGTRTELLRYLYHDSKNGKSRSGLPRGVCPCASGKPCDPKARQSNTLIPWCLPHTANRNNNWSGLYGRLDWDGCFSTTITNPEPSCKQGRVLHPEEDRVVSVRECARSQGLPDSFRLHGSIMDKYRQVGNAVPPPVVRAIGYEIKISLLSLSDHSVI